MSTIGKRNKAQVPTEPKKPVKRSKKAIENKNDYNRVASKISNDVVPPASMSASKTRNNTPKKKSKAKSEVKDIAHEEPDIKSLNVSQLLDIGEGKSFDSVASSKFHDMSDSDADEEDWEEVKMEEKTDVKDPIIPVEGVNITLELPEWKSHKRKKKQFDLEAHIKRQMNQVKREMQLLMHKVHALCWIAHLKFVNTVLNSEALMSGSLKIITNNNWYPPKHADLNYLERIIKWYHSAVELKEQTKNPKCDSDLSEQLIYQFEIKGAFSKTHYVFMLVVVLRTLGLKTRLVMSFQVVPIRPKSIDLSGKDESKTKQSEKDRGFSSTSCKKIITKSPEDSDYFSKEGTSTESKVKSKDRTKVVVSTPLSSKVGGSEARQDKKVITKIKNDIGDSEKSLLAKNSKTVAKKRKAPSEEVLDESSDDEFVSKHFKMAAKTHMRKTKGSSDSKYSPKTELINEKVDGKNISDTPKIRKRLPGKINKSKSSVSGKNKKPVNRSKKSNQSDTPVLKNEIIKKANDSSDTDSEFVPQSLKKNSKQRKIDRRVLSSDDEEPQALPKKLGNDVWVEVFLEAEEKWISVDVLKQKIHCVNELHSRATQPVVYVIACNTDSTLKDVTKRYVPHWHSDTRKRRVDETWWNKTMWPYLGPKTAQDKEEDEDINRQLHDKPLPTSITEYKDHPLYALKRHLLKFEGIYPPDAPTLGFVKGEAVYARECVVTLRSREVWYKEARVVRLKEQPYKIVKARPKWDRMTGEVKKDLPLELFGFWQTEEFIPPIAVDGKVPRNEYGNVDLFKPCMLPQGTVHLQIPALHKTAKKLGIDCVPAVVGFDFHSGASHPITDGFVVCEEFKEILLDAWNKEMDETTKRNEEKRLKRIYDNWKKLIRGLQIREKLKIKYAFGDESETSSKASGSGRKK